MNNPPSTGFPWTNLISLIGALAWIPIMYSHYKKSREKPQLQIFLEKFLRFVENEYNVVLSIRIGILTRIKETFIENMTLDLEHEQGEKRHFKWAQTIDHLSQTAINETIMPTSRILNGIAYSLPKDSFTEPYVSFINPDFRNKNEQLLSQLRVKSYYVAQQKEPKKQLELTDAFIETSNNYKHHYTWPAGDYKGTVTVVISGGRTFSKSFTFQIDQPNAETLVGLGLDVVLDKLKNNYTREESEKLQYDDKFLENGLPIRIVPL